MSDVQIVTGTIRSVQGSLAVVTPNGRGDDQAPWPDVQDCRILTLTGSGGTASLAMQPMAGDNCLLLFAGEDKTAPYCLPCSVSAPQQVAITHGKSTIVVRGDGIDIQTSGAVNMSASRLTVSAGVTSFLGNVSVLGNLGVNGSMINDGKNIGASHRHSDGTAKDGNTGAVI